MPQPAHSTMPARMNETARALTTVSPADSAASRRSASEGGLPAPRGPRQGSTATDFVLRVPTVERRRARTVRRIAAATVAADAVFATVSVLSRGRAHGWRSWLPIAVPQSSTLAALVLAIWLLGLARGLRRGQRPALLVTITLLCASVVVRLPLQPWHLDALPLAIATFLWFQRQHFRSRVDTARAWRRLVALLAAGVAALVGALGAAQVWFTARHEPHPGLGDVFGFHYAELPQAERVTIFLVALGAGGVLGYVLTTPRMLRRGAGAGLEHARGVVRRYGHDSLDYFALRDDKDFFAADGGIVAYRIIGGVCLVSPDPIGPDPIATWARFREHADEQGWPVAVLAADEEWAHRYSAAGGVSLYLGDEALVDVRGFTLEGRANRGLRQAVNRMLRAGYRVEFSLVRDLTAETRRALLDVAAKVRRGVQERGFAMALGRIADPDDPNLLIAICRDGDGEVCGFCQFVPAPAVNGWSLDVMRRDGRRHPNGMMDLIVAETISYLREQGQQHVSLNFALLRSLVEGEDLPMRGFVRRLLRWLVRNVQMDSLYRFNSKFTPLWRPRFVCVDSTEYIVPALFALISAEGFYEVPIIGRLLVPRARRSATGLGTRGQRD